MWSENKVWILIIKGTHRSTKSTPSRQRTSRFRYEAARADPVAKKNVRTSNTAKGFVKVVIEIAATHENLLKCDNAGWMNEWTDHGWMVDRWMDGWMDTDI